MYSPFQIKADTKMAALSANEKNVAITCGDKVVVLHIGPERCNAVLEPPNLTGQTAEKFKDCEGKDAEKDTVLNRETPAQIELVSYSSCNTFLALCSNNKQLSLWKRSASDWSLLSNRTIIRTASSLKFTPRGQFVLVADKSGDAYTYSVENPNEKGVLLLGHLSMLLDILVTPREDYVITCDRDEKIRVSHFPNGYNIHTYCLGHEQFVSKMALLPHNLSILVSSSGDGTVRFWEYQSGKAKDVINVSADLTANIDSLKTKEPRTGTTDSINILPIKSFTLGKFGESKSTLCALLSGSSDCIVYQITDGAENKINTQLTQLLSCDVEPWDLVFTESKHLWMTLPSKEIIQVFTYIESSSKFTSDPEHDDAFVAAAVAYVKDKCDMFKCIISPSSMTVFYKRKYDNVQVYHERKKLRKLSKANSAQSLESAK